MATQELAAMLDELMGRNRNANPNDKVFSIAKFRVFISVKFK
jgi:hypothetical protein